MEVGTASVDETDFDMGNLQSEVTVDLCVNVLVRPVLFLSPVRGRKAACGTVGLRWWLCEGCLGGYGHDLEGRGWGLGVGRVEARRVNPRTICKKNLVYASA